jgi:hypothetical protein
MSTALLNLACSHTGESPLCSYHTAWFCIGYGLSPCEAATRRKAELSYLANGDDVPLGVEAAYPEVVHGRD